MRGTQLRVMSKPPAARSFAQVPNRMPKPAEPGVTAYLEKRRDYRRNVNRVDEGERDLVGRRWARYRERFGYGVPVG